MNSFSHVPPGFRFHPTDEELVDYYLRKKVASKKIDLDVIKDVDLYNIEPWDLQELCSLGHEEQDEWYFFSHKDKKYPTGSRTNRATKAGFWKATGRDKAIYSNMNLIGMRKTLVFYKGRDPNGLKSDWIMHEYRLETFDNINATPQEEGWVVCRAFKKKLASINRREGDNNNNDSVCWYDDQAPTRIIPPPRFNYTNKEDDQFLQYNIPNDPYLELPQLEESSKVFQQNIIIPSTICSSNFLINPYNCLQSVTLTGDEELEEEEAYNNVQDDQINLYYDINGHDESAEHVTDWRVLDKFVASQLSQGDSSSSHTAS